MLLFCKSFIFSKLDEMLDVFVFILPKLVEILDSFVIYLFYLELVEILDS